LSPNNTLTRVEQWSGQNSNSWTTSDWATGVYTNQGGLGAVQFTGAANIVDFVNSVFGATGHIFISVNGGPLLFLDGTGGGATDITFYTPTLPAVNPTTVTSFEYFYSYKSGVEIDYDSNEVNIYANDADINLQTTGQRDISLDSSGDVTISANSSSTWTFDTTGNLTLPLNSVVYETNIPDGALSGSAIALKPTGGTTANQQLLIYPTANDGDHIHMTSGNLYATELFLGSDNLYVKLANTGNVVINSNDGNSSNAMWTFDTDGNLTTPSNLVIGPGTGSGSRIFQYDEGLEIVGEGANSVVLMGWTANTSAPDSVATIAMNYPSGGEGNILIAVGNNATTVNYWLFDNTGNLTLPGNTFTVNYANGTAVSLGGNVQSNIANGNSNVNIATSNGNVTIAAVGNTTMTVTGTGANITGTANISGNINTAGQLSATGNITTSGNFVGNGAALTNVTVNIAGNIVGTSSNVTLVAGSYNWTFDNTGNLTLPGNTFAVNYANNTPVDAVTRFSGTWTVPTGNSTQSFTVGSSETYQMWVDCNIPNGILAWNATATITNTNVPVVGAQYAWVYNGGGTPIDFTSIPNQFVGTANAIVRSNTAPSATTNRFDFGINNTSGGNVTVRYGWIAIS
jgi:hypothetical protein